MKEVLSSREVELMKRGYTMAEACGYLGGISRQTMYKILGDGDVSSYHIGVRVYFTKESLDKFINERVGLWPEVDGTITHDLAGGDSEYLK